MFFRLHEPASMSGSTLTWANKSTAANPAIASRFKGGCQWRGVAEPGRSANMNLLALIAVLLAGIPALSASAQFPSADSSKSPHRKWQVTCKSSEDNSGHLLVLTRIGGASVELRLFGRHCSTLWSEDGSHLAVTDWLGSRRLKSFSRWWKQVRAPTASVRSEPFVPSNWLSRKRDRKLCKSFPLP
jgi:hypothetical protein